MLPVDALDLKTDRKDECFSVVVFEASYFARDDAVDDDSRDIRSDTLVLRFGMFDPGLTGLPEASLTAPSEFCGCDCCCCCGASGCGCG